MTDPIAVVATEGSGRVVLGRKADGFFVVDPDTARDLARQLLVAAERAEGGRPAHVYQVQA